MYERFVIHMWEGSGYDSYLMISQPTDGGIRVKQQQGWCKNYKMDEKGNHFLVQVSPSIFDFFNPLHPAPIQLRSGMILKFYNVDRESCTTVLSVFLFVSNIKIYTTLYGTHPRKTGEESLYYYLYHEEASFYLDIRLQLYNRPFIVYFLI